MCAGSQRALVMIGDAVPHDVKDYRNIMRIYPFVKTAIDWRKEADELVGIVSSKYRCVYGIQSAILVS